MCDRVGAIPAALRTMTDLETLHIRGELPCDEDDDQVPILLELEVNVVVELYLVVCANRLLSPLLGRVCTFLLLSTSQLPTRMRRQAILCLGGTEVYSQDKTMLHVLWSLLVRALTMSSHWFACTSMIFASLAGVCKVSGHS
jgi:hypothetical protein